MREGRARARARACGAGLAAQLDGREDDRVAEVEVAGQLEELLVAERGLHGVGALGAAAAAAAAARGRAPAEAERRAAAGAVARQRHGRGRALVGGGVEGEDLLERVAVVVEELAHVRVLEEHADVVGAAARRRGQHVVHEQLLEGLVDRARARVDLNAQLHHGRKEVVVVHLALRVAAGALRRHLRRVDDVDVRLGQRRARLA